MNWLTCLPIEFRNRSIIFGSMRILQVEHLTFGYRWLAPLLLGTSQIYWLAKRHSVAEY